MTQLDSARLRFYRRCGEFCRASTCGRVIGALDVDFGELLPEVDAEGRLTVTVEAPVEQWPWPGVVDWFSRLDPKWSAMRPSIGASADTIVRPWIERARARILTLTWQEIVDAIQQCRTIEVPNVSV